MPYPALLLYVEEHGMYTSSIAKIEPEYPDIENIINNYSHYPCVQFQLQVGIPIGSNFASLLADLFLHSYEVLQNLVKNKYCKSRYFRGGFNFVYFVVRTNPRK